MKVLLDTHVLLWWLEGGDKLSRRVRNLIASPRNVVVVSAVSAWEISVKSAAGRLDAKPLLENFERELEQEGFTELPITARHAVLAGVVAFPHKDPFDRMLVAQAQIEGVPLASKDDLFDGSSVRRIW